MLLKLLMAGTVLGSLLACGSLLSAQTSGELPIYLDAKRSVEERVDDLMNRMTLKEKVGQLNLPCVYVDQLGRTIPEKMNACRKFAAGTYTDEIGPGSGFFTLADTILHEGVEQQVAYFNELQKIALTQTRLKIPLLEDEGWGATKKLIPKIPIWARVSPRPSCGGPKDRTSMRLIA